MPSHHLVGIDVGQTAVKAVVYDEELRTLAVARRDSPVDRPAPRFAERSQDALWDATAEALAESVAASGIDPASVVGVASSGHGDGLHLVAADGSPVGPAITAMDSRAWQEAETLAADPERGTLVLERSGQTPTPSAAGNLLAWLLRHDPERVAAAERMLFCKDVIRLRLTGTIGTDFSDATASFLDTDQARWSDEIIAAYGLPAEISRLLPEITPSASTIGAVTAEAAARTGLLAGTPVMAGLHDVQAASIGMGALVEGRLACVAGSFSTNGVTTRQGDVDPRWQSRLSITPDLRIAMSTSATASPSFAWMLRLLGIHDDAARDALLAEAAALPEDADVPLILPFVDDSPLGAAASGMFAGVRSWHGRAHVARGMLEGIALMHVWHTRALGEKFGWEEPVRLGGGLSRSPLYTQLVADALGTPVAVVETPEMGSFGAAALAGTGAGVFASIDAAQSLVPLAAPVAPRAGTAAYWRDKVAAFDSLATAANPWWQQQVEAAS